MIKTLIELFDESQIENVIASLRCRPEKIIYVGYKNVMTSGRKRAIEEFFKSRGIEIETEYEIVGRYDYAELTEKLNKITDDNEDCCFDITGGKELTLVAVGEIAEKKHLPVLQFNIRDGRLIRVARCGDIPDTGAPSLTIPELIRLNGGAVLTEDPDEFTWNIDKDFKKDLEVIWGNCKKNSGFWNSQCEVLANFEKYGKKENGLTVTVNTTHMKSQGHRTYISPGLINSFVQNGIFTHYEKSEDILTFTYKNEQIYHCLRKAGSILEHYAYILLCEIGKENSGYYDDIDIGVYVDWDGVVHCGKDKVYETKNEIDIIVMRDAVPIFISCKNGEVKKEALYELDTVAMHFGGSYSKKVLLTTYISSDAGSRKYILQRAKDMGIEIIEGVDKLDREEFSILLKKIIK